MPTIQELLTTLHRAAPEQAELYLNEIVEAVKMQDTILAAFFPPTRNWFITKEYGQQTAVLFSNRDSFERFAERCKEQGLYCAAIENGKEDRELLFADLWRCGFTRILIDYAPEFVNLHLEDFFTPPDLSNLPLAQRPVLNPAVTGEILWLFQQIHSGKADGGMELSMLSELYHSAFLLPAEKFTAEGAEAFHVSTVERDGKRCIKLYTDRREWARDGVPEDAVPTIARYADLKALLAQGAERLVINPGNGAELVLDAQLLEVAEKAVTGETEGLTLQAMQERGEKLTVTDPAEIPDELRDALYAVLQNHPEVQTAYLRVLKRENVLHPSWLLLLDRSEDRGESALHRELGDHVKAYLGAYAFECVSYEKARSWAGNAKPFYQKKRFGFWK